MPFGGIRQRTPNQAMVNLIAVEKEHTSTCSLMSWGYNPFIAEKSPYHSAYLAVVESVSKLIAAGASFEDVYLSFQEYFEKPMRDPKRWGKPMAAVLGAFKAQKELGVAAIGGKDSMSGTFEDIDVPPTLVSFAVTTDDVANIISPEFKEVDNNVFMFIPEYDEEGLPKAESLKAIYKAIHQMIKDGTIISAYTPGYGGAAEAVLKMSMGNEIGFAYSEDVDLEKIFGYAYGAFVVEVSSEAIDNIIGADIIDLGKTTAEKAIVRGDERIDLAGIEKIYEDKLEPIYSCNIETADNKLETFSYETSERLHAKVRIEKPKVLIPVFPGNNCEYDSAKAFRDAGAEPEIFVINNLSAEAVAKSVEDFAAKVRESQIIFIPGGFSGGDEPDGSGKFITAFFRNQEVKEAVTDLLDNREGLMVGICNGFQALIKLGLVPYGKIMDIDETFPTLTFNEIGREHIHVSGQEGHYIERGVQ